MFSNWIVAMGSPEGGGAGGMFTLVWFALIFVVMYLLLIRPQQKKAKEHQKLLNELKKGDKVVTNGGMFGTIFAIDEERGRIVLKIGEDVRMEFLKSAIAAKVDN